MKILGITGGSGSGKTTLLRAVEQLGGLGLDCDAIYHCLLETDDALVAAIGARFPGTVRDGRVDRPALAAVVFADPAELAALLDAVEALEIDSVSDLSVTDWYPRLRLSCADGTSWSVGFNGHCLEVDRTHYNLRNDDAFWTLTRRLLKKYAPEE